MKLKSSSLFFLLTFFVLCIVQLSGCGNPETGPAEKLARQLQNESQFAIILNDMKQEGNFFPSYYHQYRVDVGENSKVYPFIEVSDSYFRKNQPYLGMVLASKAEDGKITYTPFPNGYQYVGNSQYGQWRTDASGGSFWEFYGKYMMISQVMNWAGHGLGRNYYNTYSTYRVKNRPYMGPNGEHGTNGTITKRQKPNFYKRRQMRKTRSTSRFKDKVNRRIGRSKNNFRSRGFGFGK